MGASPGSSSERFRACVRLRRSVMKGVSSDSPLALRELSEMVELTAVVARKQGGAWCRPILVRMSCWRVEN